MFDVCIVGGGVSALVFALEFRKRYPETTLAILEREPRLGGRLRTERFHGFRVPLGGSMVRGGDKRVQTLCKDLGLDILPVDRSSYLTSREEKFNNQMIQDIQIRGGNILEEGEDPTVREFLEQNFPAEDIQKFLQNVLYRDFLESSLREFLDYYPPEDLLQPEGREHGLFYVKGGYGALIDKLKERIENDDRIQIYLETEVQKVKFRDEKIWKVKTSWGSLETSLVIWATGWSGVEMLPDYPKHLVQEYIAPVPFIRAAGFSKDSELREGIVCGGELGKVFPLRGKVFQLAYTESSWAVELYNQLRNKTKEEAIPLFQTLLEKNVPGSIRGGLRIDDVLVKFWEAGIHQYVKSPSDEVVEEIQKPFFGFYMIGEMIVRENKGWTEGALQSVEQFFQNHSFQMTA